MMKEKQRNNTWPIVVGLVILAGAVVGWLAWESRGRPGLGSDAGPVTEAPADKMASYQRLCEGKSLAGEGNHAEALAVFEELSRTEAGTRYGWNAEIEAAQALGRLGRFDDALARLQRIVKECTLEEEIPNARLVEADVHSLAGRADTAVKILEDLIAQHTETRALVCEEALREMVAVYDRTEQYGLVRGALGRVMSDYRGSEDTARMWAERQASRLQEMLQGKQKSALQNMAGGKPPQIIRELTAPLTTWTAQDGPYFVTRPLAIGADVTLRIEAGARVQFGVLGGLEVKGTLECLGTQEQPVTLTTFSGDPVKEWWAGVILSGGNSRLHHCAITGADIGIRVAKARVELDHCTLSRCGQVALWGMPGAELTVTGCTVEGTHRIGVSCEQQSTLQMADCTVARNMNEGIVLKEVSESSVIRQSRIERSASDGVLVRGQCSPRIDGCRIVGNGRHGFHAAEGASPTIVNTQVADNSGAGIRLEERWGGAIRGSTITGNRQGGIVADVRCAGEIAGNRIESNDGFGLLLRLGCNPAVTGNLFARNKGPGLLLEDAVPGSLRDNQFIENTGPALRNAGTAPVQAAHNWWGTTDAGDIARMIEDRRDNPKWGPAEIEPWLQAPPASPGRTKPAS